MRSDTEVYTNPDEYEVALDRYYLLWDAWKPGLPRPVKPLLKRAVGRPRKAIPQRMVPIHVDEELRHVLELPDGGREKVSTVLQRWLEAGAPLYPSKRSRGPKYKSTTTLDDNLYRLIHEAGHGNVTRAIDSALRWKSGEAPTVEEERVTLVVPVSPGLLRLLDEARGDLSRGEAAARVLEDLLAGR